MHNDLVCCIWIIFLVSSVAARSDKRDLTPPLETVVIPLSLSDTNKYSVSVDMSPGSTQQSLSFAITTSTGYSVVAGVSCDECDGVSGYNTSKSTTVKQLPDVQSVSLLGANASGGLIDENCQLRESNGSAWVYPNQTLIVANTSSNLFSPGVSGVFGLGTNGGRNGDFSATVFSGFFSRNPGQTNFSFGMMLNPPFSGGNNGGRLDWQSPNTASYEGEVVWQPISYSNSTSLQFDWFVIMNSLSFTYGGNNVTISRSGDLVATVDPFESAMIFPQSVAGAIYGGIDGASLIPSLTAATNKWQIPCDTEMSLTLTFGSLSVPVDQTALVVPSDNGCFGTIEEWSDPQVEVYSLGSSFISILYIIFSISESGQSSIGFARRKTLKKLSGGAVAGIVVGSVFFTVMLSLGLLFLYRGYKKRRDGQVLTPFISPPSTPSHELLLYEGQRGILVESTRSTPSYNRDEFGLLSLNDQGQEVMAALPSSVFTPVRATYTSMSSEALPPYHTMPPTLQSQPLRRKVSNERYN